MDRDRPIEWDDVNLEAQAAAATRLTRRTRVPRERAEDAVADAAVSLIRKQATTSDPGGLLFVTALNLLRDSMRRGVRIRELPDALPATGGGAETPPLGGDDEPESHMEVTEEQVHRSERVARALGKLSEADRDLLTSVYLDGRPPLQLDEEQGEAPGTSKQRVHRARKRLRIVMGAGTPSRGKGR